MFHVAKSKDSLRKAFAVRAIVFLEEQQVPYNIEIDEYEDTAVHVLGELGSEPMAVGRLRFVEEYARIERLAVRKSYRRAGYGTLLLKYLEGLAREQGYNEFRLHAQVASQKFYLNNDFKPVGDEFLEAGIWHIRMVKRINS